MSQALVIIDIQNDYFQSKAGGFPLHASDEMLAQVLKVIYRAKQAGVPCVLVQHIADTTAGPAPFFNPGTSGVELHEQIMRALPQAPIVVKAFADAFHETNLDATLQDLGARELVLCGMMTQNCVAHTALSKAAETYEISVLTDACTTVSDALHAIALHALSTRVQLKSSADVFEAKQADGPSLGMAGRQGRA